MLELRLCLSICIEEAVAYELANLLHCFLWKLKPGGFETKMTSSSSNNHKTTKQQPKKEKEKQEDREKEEGCRAAENWSNITPGFGHVKVPEP